MSHDAFVKFYGSKSTANADDEDGHDNLGGYISSDELVCLRARPCLINGVQVTGFAPKNTEGAGSLKYDGAGKKIQWKAPRDSNYGNDLDISAGGVFYIESATANCWLEITVDAGQLLNTDQTVPFIFDRVPNVVFSDVNVGDTMNGLQDYRCIIARNESMSILNNVRPNIEVPANAVAIAEEAYYDQSGEARIVLASAPTGFPSSYFIRNKRSQEIMYYTSRGNRGIELVVPSIYRGLRGSSAAFGDAGDLIELISPIDIFVRTYQQPEPTIIGPTAKPADISFYYPQASDAPQYGQVFNLNAGDMLAIWMRRNIPPGCIDLANMPFRFSLLAD